MVIIASHRPDITTYLLFQRRSRCASCGMLRTGGTLNTRARIRECGLKSIIIA